VSLQTLQLGSDVRRVLVAHVAVLREAFLNNAFQIRRHIGIQARGTGSRLRMPSQMRPAVFPENGCAPVAISYSTTPNEKRSVRASTSCPRTCSGDIYDSVPIA